jgi:chromosomal replication initiation ATPase DnaA
MTLLTTEEIRAMRAASTRGGATVFWALADEVAEGFGVTVAQLKATGRGSLVANDARQFLSLYATRRGISAGQIGRWLGGRDRSTISHAIKQAEAKEAAALARESP